MYSNDVCESILFHKYIYIEHYDDVILLQPKNMHLEVTKIYIKYNTTLFSFEEHYIPLIKLYRLFLSHYFLQKTVFTEFVWSLYKEWLIIACKYITSKMSAPNFTYLVQIATSAQRFPSNYFNYTGRSFFYTIEKYLLTC